MRTRPIRAGILAGALLALAPCGVVLADTHPLPPAKPSFPDLPLPPDVPPPSGLVSAMPAGRLLYLPIAAAEAMARGLPPEVADAVMRVESAYNPKAVGGVGERGLMQVLPSTATMLGFTGTPDELADPAVNIRLGVTYLAGAWKLAGGDLCRTLMKYRAGHNQERMSALSVEYCRRAKSHLAALGSPLGAGALPSADFGTFATTSVVPGPEGGRVVRVAGRLRRVASGRPVVSGRRFWAVHTARIKAIEARLPWRRGGILAGT